MAIPDFQSCMRPLLAHIEDGQEIHFLEALNAMYEHFGLTDEEIHTLLPSGKQTVIKNRCGWARTYMKKAGLLAQPKRGFVQITEEGKKVLQDVPDRITVRYLKDNFPAFLEFHTSKPNPAPPVGVEEETDPTERLEQAHSEITQELIAQVLDGVKEQSPQFLEHLVVELMQSMGYGGWSKDSGEATQYTADGGIDGIINEDPLGLEKIYLQAKRYTTGNVGRPDVQAFVGALEMQRARKGVFITTSSFSREAAEYVNHIEKKIILIDGEKLATLMIENNLGVTVKDTYQIKQLDTDFFDEE